MIRLAKRGPRTYYAETPVSQVFVFGSSAPLNLWAWAVYGYRATFHGVEHSYATARRRAIAACQQIAVAEDSRNEKPIL